jgi:hypothetical protein
LQPALLYLSVQRGRVLRVDLQEVFLQVALPV